MTLASIVIPTRGGARRLPMLLKALAAQDDPDWEAVVVIDGDVDRSEDVVARHVDLPVRSLVFPENRGRVAALNAGFAAARGDILIRCDDDMTPAPDFVREHCAAHRQGPRGIVGLPLNVSPPTPYWRAYGSHADVSFRRAAYASPASAHWRYWGGNVSVTREIHESIGGYSHAYRGYGYEDVDYGYRLHQAGVPVMLVPALEIRHHMAAVTTAIRALRAYDAGSGRRIFEKRHGQSPLGDPWALDHTAWNAAVRTVARTLDRSRTARVSRAVDRAARALPPLAARKAIALIVEAAGLAGYARGGA